MVEILDSTLREGEQTPGVKFTVAQKVEIAEMLDTFGVDYIEAGHPAVSPDVMEGVREVASLGLDAEVVAHSRALTADIDLVLRCGVPWVGIFFSVSDRGLEERFRKDLDEAVELILGAIEYAKAHGLRVRYTPEDTVRTPLTSLVRVCEAAESAGVDRISIADTAGVMTPLRFHGFVRRLLPHVKVPLHVHCHNDLGMAVANAVTAVDAGVECVDVCVNGLGERCGIASLAEVCTSLRFLAGVDNGWHLEMLPEISRTVARYSGVEVHPHAPITGRNAFTHCAGLHVAAVLKDPSHYEFIPASAVGRVRGVVLDRFSGRDAVSFRLRSLGITPEERLVEDVLLRLKEGEMNDVDDEGLLSLLEGMRGSPAQGTHVCDAPLDE